MHEATYPTGMFDGRDQRADDQRKYQYAGIARIREHVDDAFDPCGNTRERVESIKQGKAHPDTGKQ
jgi:hypothetical protein